ncbi:MAG TPA: hypothetical protein PLB89_05140 [Flavobacteriales bacterium]|nr:hypothetical protein [Flavobacteriales bacterium]
MDRATHLAWAKERAKEYLDRGDADKALGSFISDMGKHEDLADPPLSADLRAEFKALFERAELLAAYERGPDALREYINGFN